jgi:hypothetical protein
MKTDTLTILFVLSDHYVDHLVPTSAPFTSPSCPHKQGCLLSPFLSALPQGNEGLGFWSSGPHCPDTSAQCFTPPRVTYRCAHCCVLSTTVSVLTYSAIAQVRYFYDSARVLSHLSVRRASTLSTILILPSQDPECVTPCMIMDCR